MFWINQGFCVSIRNCLNLCFLDAFSSSLRNLYNAITIHFLCGLLGWKPLVMCITFRLVYVCVSVTRMARSGDLTRWQLDCPLPMSKPSWICKYFHIYKWPFILHSSIWLLFPGDLRCSCILSTKKNKLWHENIAHIYNHHTKNHTIDMDGAFIFTRTTKA